MPKGSWREFENIPSRDSPDSSENIPLIADRSVRVHRTRGGKGGKTVTIISGLDLNLFDAKNLLKKLKTSCGTGGTIKESNIELQGNQVQAAIEVLKEVGFKPKQSGS